MLAQPVMGAFSFYKVEMSVYFTNTYAGEWFIYLQFFFKRIQKTEIVQCANYSSLRIAKLQHFVRNIF